MPEPIDIDSIELPEDSEIHELLRVCPDIEGVRFANDEFVVHGEDTAMDIFLIIRGNCLVEQPDAPRERTPGSELAVILVEPDAPVFIGEMAYLGGGYRTASVRSVMATVALRLQPRHLDTIMVKLPGITGILCRQFSQRLGEANNFIKAYQEKNVMDMVQRFVGPGEVIVNAGDTADTLFQIVDGRLIETEGGEDVFQPEGDWRDFVHPMPFFQGGKHPATVVVKEPSVILGFSGSCRDAIVRNFPELAVRLLQEK